MRCSACYRPITDEFMHRVSGECRASAKTEPSKSNVTWTRLRKVREHSGPWPSAEHGTRARYQGNSTRKGCRCAKCVAANYAYHAGWRKRRKATT